jgi:hypothetical protein
MGQQFWLDLLAAVVGPLAQVLVTVILALVVALANTARKKTSNAYALNYLNYLEDVVRQAVVATNQTYVDAIKAGAEDGKLTAEEAEMAFAETYDAIRAIVTAEGETLAKRVVGDFGKWLENAIESMVSREKWVSPKFPPPAPAPTPAPAPVTSG